MDRTQVIVAEFFGAMVLVGLGTFLDKPKPNQPQANVVHTHITRLTAVCAVYFVLGLMSSGQRVGKVAAAFGGLVLLGVAFSEKDLLGGITMPFTAKGGFLR